MILLTLTPEIPLLVFCLLADTVVLKNGSEIQGEIIKETGDRIVLRFEGGTIELQRRRVETVRREPRVRYLLAEGERQLLRGSHEAAAASFRAAIEEDPGSRRARAGLLAAREGRAADLTRLGRHAEAKALYRELIEEGSASDEAALAIEAIDRTLEDARREEERGLEELRSGDVEKGLWRLQRVHDVFPERREAISLPMARALVEVASRHLDASRWADAESSYLRAMTIEPDLEPLVGAPFARAVQGMALPLLARGEFEEAETIIARGLDVSPESEVLRYYHGLCLEARGRTRDAALEYLSVVGGRRPRSLETAAVELRVEAERILADAGKTPPLASPHSDGVVAGEFRELETERFIVLHKSPSVAEEVALVAERSYRTLLRELGCATHVGTPLTIVLYPDREAYRAASEFGEWSAGSHRIVRRLGALSSHRILTYQGQPRLYSGVLPHEIAHALLAHRLSYPERIPLWANEGFAVTRESAYFRQHVLRSAATEMARRNLIPVQDLIAFEEYPSDRIELFYAQSMSLVEFLLSLKGTETFLGFLQAMSRPRPEIDRELKRFYDISGQRALESRWVAWLERSLR